MEALREHTTQHLHSLLEEAYKWNLIGAMAFVAKQTV